MNKEELHFTKLFRAQRPDRPMLECFNDARRHIHFRKTLTASVKEHQRRSRAAKKAWKARKAVQA